MDDWGAKPWATFAEKAIAFRKAIGADSHPVISREKHPQEWRDWYAYYGARGMLASQEMMRAKSEKTVPTISPFDFDASFNPRCPSSDAPDDRKRSTHNLEPDEQRIRMGFKLTLLAKAVDLRQVDALAEANMRGLEDLVALAQKWGVDVPESVWAQIGNSGRLH